MFKNSKVEYCFLSILSKQDVIKSKNGLDRVNRGSIVLEAKLRRYNGIVKDLDRPQAPGCDYNVVVVKGF